MLGPNGALQEDTFLSKWPELIYQPAVNDPSFDAGMMMVGLYVGSEFPGFSTYSY